jgi:hypothetical protein
MYEEKSVMKSRELIRRSCCVVVMALFCFGPGAFAQSKLTQPMSAAALTRGSGVFMLEPLWGDPNRDKKKNKQVAAPEGGSAALYLLLAGLACAGAMRMRSHSQARAGRSL